VSYIKGVNCNIFISEQNTDSHQIRHYKPNVETNFWHLGVHIGTLVDAPMAANASMDLRVVSRQSG